MAYPLWQIVDPADDTTVLFDMNDPTGAANPNSVKTYIGDADFDLGSDEYETSTFDFEDRDGGEVVYARRRLTEFSWSLRAQATTYANLVAGIGTLGKYLERGGVIKYQASASDTAQWIDFVPAPAPALFRGQMRALFKVLTLLQDPDGVVLVARRQPGLRLASVTFGPTTVPNDPADTNGRSMTFTIPGDLPCTGSLKVQAPASAKLKEILVSRRSQGAYPTTRVSDWASTTKYAQLNATGGGWTMETLPSGSASVADTDASGGNTLEITAGVEMLKRVRISRTANLDSLRGDFDVYMRLKAGAGKFIPQLRWAPSLANPVTNAEPEALPLDGTGLGTLPYSDWYMGRISLPQGHMLGGIALELWARRESGAGTLRADFVTLVPAGAQDTLSVIRAPEGATETWTGNQLLTPLTEPGGLGTGTIDGTSMVFNANNEAAGTAPQTGFIWPAGRHVFKVTGYNNARTSASLTFRVRNLTDDTYPVTKTFTPQYTFTRTIEFDVGVGTHAATDAYQVQIVDVSGTSDTNSTNNISIWTIEHSFTTYLVSGEEAHAEVNKGMLHKMDSSDNIVSHLDLIRGPFPFRGNPGLEGLYLQYGDIPSESGAPGNNSVLTEDCIVTVTVQPRRKT